MQKISVVGFRLSMILAVGAFTFVGCEGNNPPPKSTVPASGSHDHGHDHDHDHGHDHSAHGHDHDHAHAHKGPHDGSLVEVGDEEYHLEWTFDDSTGKVVIYVIDSTAKKEVPIEAGELTVTVKIGDMTMDYKLAAVGATGEPAKSFQFEAIDKTLIEGLKTGGLGVETKTKLTIGGKQFDVEFKQDAHAK